MNIIVVVDQNWGIGKDNDLLFRLPLDMAFFKETTTGNIVAMGSNTFRSLPGPLKDRTNIVLDASSREIEGCVTARSLDELKEILRQYDSERVYVIGGGMFYRTMLPYCSQALVTKVDADGQANVFFENLDRISDWELIDEGAPLMTNGYNIRFTRYRNKAVQSFCESEARTKQDPASENNG